jgi:hypothetical protein
MFSNRAEGQFFFGLLTNRQSGGCEALRLTAAGSVFIFSLALQLHIVTNIIIKLLHVVTKTQHKRRYDGQLHCHSGTVQCNEPELKANKQTHNIFVIFVCFVQLVGVLWVCCGCAVGVLWVCCGCAVGVLWVYCGCTVGVLWVCCGCTVGVLWVCCGCTVGVLWVYCGCAVGVLWVCCGCAVKGSVQVATVGPSMA